MKKITSLIILTIIAIMMFARPTYATLSSENNITTELTWQRITLDGKYALRSSMFQIEFAEISMEFNTTYSGWDNFIVQNSGAIFSHVDIYNSQTPGAPIKIYDVEYEAPLASEVMFLFDSEGNTNVDVSSYSGKYMQITLMLDPYASQSLAANIEYWMNNYRNNYDFSVIVRYELSDQVGVSDLPLTLGNPTQENPGKTGKVEDYFYDPVSNTFYMSLVYNELYSVAIPNVGFDDDFLESVSSINYYSIESEKFLQFDFIDSEEVILTESGEYATQWTGFAVWNLSTNELIVYNRALALTYIDVEADRDVYGYLYLPNIPIDNVISVAGFFNYRFGYKDIILRQKYREWETLSFILEKDKSSFGYVNGVNGIYGELPQWSYDVLSYSAVAGGVGLALTALIPGVNVAYGLLYLGAIGLNASLLGGAIDKVATGKISDIETINPDIHLRSKLNTYYSLAAEETLVLPNDVDIHKLYYGSFTSLGSNLVDIDDNSLTYTQIVWVTNGSVYELSEPFIDSKTQLDLEDQAPPEDTRDPLQVVGDFIVGLFKAIFNSEVMLGVRVVIGLALTAVSVFVLIRLGKLFKTGKKALKSPFVLIGLGIAIIGVLVLLGFVIF